ncbi:conserved Plasmodium protein, unknown function [Plasmodium gallinaceum]|uniref:Sel1 repeat-containing protein n=1 Tax=Plasmodium gallinaceum TaxID=5849 RepID=A0A1J1GSH4_PLAGA|nr:conserved Plasmodium protein, unknown function [Plasmodium gallinaceum]CRG95433.1 conserved Plasmodium protein, unknown function [Plasmodium gallinaceum]
MIKNVFYLIFIFSFFLLIIKCEYITNEKEEIKFEEETVEHHKRNLNNHNKKELNFTATNNKSERGKKEKEIKIGDINEENNNEKINESELNIKKTNKKDVSIKTKYDNENKIDIKKRRKNTNKEENFLLLYEEEIEKYDRIIDELILRSMSKKNYDYFNILEEYSLKTKLNSDIYDSLKDLIKIINSSSVLIHSYMEKKNLFKYDINENIFKRHFILSLFRWYNSFKLIETCFDKTNYVFYIDDHKIYSYKYTYKLVLNLLNSENFLFYVNFNKISFINILDNYNKYNFKINNTIRNYPSHFYVCQSFNDFIYSYFLHYNHQFFEKYKYLVDKDIWDNKVTTGNHLFKKLKDLNNNLILYKFQNDSNVKSYLNMEIKLIFSTFKEFIIDILNNLYNEYYFDNLRHIREKSKFKNEENNKLKNTENEMIISDNINENSVNINTKISNNYEENKETNINLNDSDLNEINNNIHNKNNLGEYYDDVIKNNVKNKEQSYFDNRNNDINEKKVNNEVNIDKMNNYQNKIYDHSYDDDMKHDNVENLKKKKKNSTMLENEENSNIYEAEVMDTKDDDNEVWNTLIDSYNKLANNEDYKKYNKYILKNIHKFFNLSSENLDELNNYKNKYELKDGYIINNTTDKRIPLFFHPIKDIFSYLNQVHIKKKINFKDIYEYLVTINNYNERNNFYDNHLQCRSGIFFKEFPLLKNYSNEKKEIKSNIKNLMDINEKFEKKNNFEINKNKFNDTFVKNKNDGDSNEMEANNIIDRVNINNKNDNENNYYNNYKNINNQNDIHYYDYYNNINLSAFTPAPLLMKDKIHDQLKLLRTKYTDKLKNESNCVLAFLYLIGVNDHNGNLQFPYGFPRNIDKSVNLIRKGKDGLCNFLSGILYHVNLPIFVNNSSISITTEVNDEVLDVNENSINSFFYIYYKNKSVLRNHDFLSDKNRIIPNKVDHIKSKIVSYSLGSTKDDFYSKLAFTNNIIRLKYKNEMNNFYLKDYFDFTYDKKDYKNSFIKNNVSPFLTSCDYLLSNILGVVVDSLKATSTIESGIYEEYINENHKNLIRNSSDNNKNLYEYFLKLADSRNSYALAALGEIYFLGNENIGIERDEQKAFEFWKKAADQGDSISALSTGYAYLDEYKKFSKKEETIKNMNKEELINLIKSENSNNEKNSTEFDMYQESDKKKKKKINKNEKKNNNNDSNNNKKENSNDYYSFLSTENKEVISKTTTNETNNSLNNTSNNNVSPDQTQIQNNSSNYDFFMNGTSNFSDFSNNTYQTNSNNINTNDINSSNIDMNRTVESNININNNDVDIKRINKVNKNTENNDETNDENNNVENLKEKGNDENDEIIKNYILNLNNKANKAFKNAENYFNKAIRNNDGSLESALAKYNIYKFGLGRKPNIELAGYYLKKAAEKGDNIAQMLLGHYYSGTDIGIKLNDYNEDKIENLKKSYKYYALSAKNGNLISLYNKSILILKGINPKFKSFNEKCSKTLKYFHFISLFNERLYVLTKMLKRNYEFKDYTGSLLLSIMLSELGDHPSNVNASLLWNLKKKTMKKFTEKYNIIENILKNFNISLNKENTNSNNNNEKVNNDYIYSSNDINKIIKRIYNKEKSVRYSYKNKGRKHSRSLLKNCMMISVFNKKKYFTHVKFCHYLKSELLRIKRSTNNYKHNENNNDKHNLNETVHGKNNGKKNSSYRNVEEKEVNYYDTYYLSKYFKQIDLYEKYDKIIINEMKKEKNIEEKIKRLKKMKYTILEHFRITEFLHCYYKPISYYQIKLEEEKQMKQQYNNRYIGEKGEEERKNLYESEFSRYSSLLENHDIQEIFYYKKKYTSNIFEEIQSFSNNCDVCKQYYDIYSSYYGYKKATIDLIKKYHEGDEFTVKSKRKELQYMISDSDAENHESLYYKALFLEHNNLDNLKNILEIYFKLAIDNHNACNVIGFLGILKIFFKKIFYDINIFNRKKKYQFPLNTFIDFNKCPLQNYYLFKTEFDQKCFNFDYLIKDNYIYSQIRYFDFLKVLYNLISSFFKIK